MIGYSRYAALRGPFRSGLLFLFHLAWKSRIRLPVLIAIGFMVLDIRMQLEINIDLGRAGRELQIVAQDVGQPGINDPDSEDDDTFPVEDGESDSYTTDSYTLHSGYSTSSDEDNLSQRLEEFVSNEDTRSSTLQ